MGNAALLRQEMARVFASKGWLEEIEKEGIEKGTEKRNIEIALQMLSDQKSEEEIIISTGYTVRRKDNHFLTCLKLLPSENAEKIWMMFSVVSMAKKFLQRSWDFNKSCTFRTLNLFSLP